MTSSEASKTWLSQDAYDRLQAELDELIAARPAVAAEINARREEGDLRENGGYHAAREEQGKQEGRIRQLTDLLRKARVGEPPTTATNAALGAAIVGAAPGETVTYQAPNGRDISVKVLAVEPFIP